MSIQAYQLSGAGQASIPNPSISSPRSPTTTDIVSPAGNPYQILQGWKNTTTGAVYEYAGGGVWVEVVDSGGGGPITTLTGNTGGAIAPIAGNINILGNAQATFAGTAGTLTLTQTAAGYPITPFVVGAVGKAGYQTIQSAITAAALAGSGTVYVQPGTYTENLTLVDSINIVGLTHESTILVGVHVPPASGQFCFQNMTLQSATHIFSSATAGSAQIVLELCNVNVTNGYLFNLLNWTGTLQVFNSGSIGTNDGFINNTGGATVFCNSVVIGAGTVNAFTMSGNVLFSDTRINCPGTFQGSGTVLLGTSTFLGTITTAATVTVLMGNCICQPNGVTAAISHGSSNSFTIDETIINSSAANVIGGAGAGSVILGNITFDTNSGIASTITTAYKRTINRVTPYIVGSTGNYSTIQAAVTAAIAAGGAQSIYVQPGTYTENLSFVGATALTLTAASTDGNFGDTIISGVHTPNTSGTLQLNNFQLVSATNILNSASAGTTRITLSNCNLVVTTGYTLNLASWTGTLELFNCNNAGTTDGGINNTGGSAVNIFESGIGNGTANSMTVSGVVTIYDTLIGCPLNPVTGASFSIYGSVLSRTATLSNNSTGTFDRCTFSTGATAAVTMSSSAAVSILNSIITSSNNPAIAGAGAGALTIGSTTFTSNTATAGTLTLGTATLEKCGSYQSLAFGTASGATPQAVNTRVGAVTFTGVSIAGNATSAFVLQNSTISGATTIVQYTLVGATTGSALTIQSVVNAAGQSTVTIMNGTGLTTTTADITLIFNVLN